MTTPTAVIVLAAGAGTRMKSSLPKVVHPVVGRSMIGHALHAAAGTHPDHLVAVVRHQRELVAAEILRNNPDVIIADQDDIPGTGRAVQCALDELLRRGHSLSGTILVTYGDVPMLDADTLNALVRSHDERGATAVMSVESSNKKMHLKQSVRSAKSMLASTHLMASSFAML